MVRRRILERPAVDLVGRARAERLRCRKDTRRRKEVTAHVVERACALADGDRLRIADLPDALLSPDGAVAVPGRPGDEVVDAARATTQGLSLKDAKGQWMGVLEASYLRDLLARHDGNVSAAAKTAGIDRKTFHRLINKYKLK